MDSNEDLGALRISDADRNGTMRRLHNAVALGLIDISEFEQRSSLVSHARTRTDLDGLVGDLPGPGAIVTDWRDQNHGYFVALQVEHNVMFLILTMIILVGAGLANIPWLTMVSVIAPIVVGALAAAPSSALAKRFIATARKAAHPS